MFDFSAYITDRTRDFVGREWVFAEIDRWLAAPEAPRYFIITGEPGIGKTAIAARLTQIRHLDAYHFCIARQADTMDPLDFARAISHQLTAIDAFAINLLEEQGIHIDARLNVRQNYGEAINVNIERLIGMAQQRATTVFNRIVVNPLKLLYADGFDRQLVILVDALDEAAQWRGMESIVGLLANARGLPPQVQFVLTSRPGGEVLRYFKRQHIPHLVLDAGREENQQDVRAYVQHRVATSAKLCARLSQHMMDPKTFVKDVAEASEGNFLYISILLEDMETGQEPLNSFSTLPHGLDEIYHDFLCRFNVSDWAKHYEPLLGVLAVAQEPLTETLLSNFCGLRITQVHQYLGVLQQFLNIEGKGAEEIYSLFHQSFRDYLLDGERNRDFWCIPEDNHRRIVDYVFGNFSADWTECNLYGLKYLSEHLRASGELEKLYELLTSTPAWMTAKFRAFHTYELFRNDLSIARQSLAALDRLSDVITFIRIECAYLTLATRVGAYSNSLLAALSYLDHENEAIAHAKMRSRYEDQISGLLVIADVLTTLGEDARASSILDQAYNIATLIEGSSRGTSLGAIASKFVAIDKNRSQDIFAEVEAGLNELGKDQDVFRQALRELVIDYAFAAQSSDVIRLLKRIQVFSEKEGEVDIFIALKSQLLGLLSYFLVIFNDQERAVCYADQSFELREQIDNKSRCFSLNVWMTLIIVFGLLKKQHRVHQLVEEALAINNSISEFRLSGDQSKQQKQNLVDIAIAVACAGDLELANTIVEELESSNYNAEFLYRISIEAERQGKSELSLSFAKQAYQRSSGIEDIEVRGELLDGIALAMARAGAKERAFTILDQAKFCNAADFDERKRSTALTALVCRLSNLERYDKALKIAGLITDEKIRAQAVSPLTQAIAKGGDPDRAYQILKSTHYMDHSIVGADEVLTSVAVAFARKGEIEKAIHIAGSRMLWPHERVDPLCRVASVIKEDDPHFEVVMKRVNFSVSGIPTHTHDFLCLAKLAVGRLWFELGDVRKYESYLEAAENLVDDSQWGFDRFDEQVEVIKGFLEIPDRRSREKGFSLVQKLCESPFYLGAHHLRMANILIDESKIDKACQVVEIVLSSAKEKLSSGGNERLDGAYVISDLVGVLGRLGRFEDSISLIETHLEPGHDWQIEALISLASAVSLKPKIYTGRYLHMLQTLLRFLPRDDSDVAMQLLFSFASLMESIAPYLSLEVIREATRIIGWTRPDWREVYKSLD